MAGRKGKLTLWNGSAAAQAVQAMMTWMQVPRRQ
jgi:hypothetical protein